MAEARYYVIQLGRRSPPRIEARDSAVSPARSAPGRITRVAVAADELAPESAAAEPTRRRDGPRPPTAPRVAAPTTGGAG